MALPVKLKGRKGDSLVSFLAPAKDSACKDYEKEDLIAKIEVLAVTVSQLTNTSDMQRTLKCMLE